MSRSPGLTVLFLLQLTLTQLMVAPVLVTGEPTEAGLEANDLQIAGPGNLPPTALIVKAPASQVNATEHVVLRGTGSDSDGFVVGYNWWSNLDGNLSHASGEVVFDNLSVGEHVIYFAVLDNNQTWSPPDRFNLTVLSPPVPVITDIRHYPYSLQAGSMVRFSGSSASSGSSGSSGSQGTPGQRVEKYRWDLEGDGRWDIITSNDNIQHRYTTPGHYCPTVMVQAENGQWSESYTSALYVSERPDRGPEGSGDDEAWLGGLCLLFLIFAVPLATYRWGSKSQLKRCQDQGHALSQDIKRDSVELMNEALASEGTHPTRALARYKAIDQKESELYLWIGVLVLGMIFLLVNTSEEWFFGAIFLGFIAFCFSLERPIKRSTRELAPLGIARCHLRLDEPDQAQKALREARGLYPYHLNHLYTATRSLASGQLKAASDALDRAYRIPRPGAPTFYYLALGLTQSLLETRLYSPRASSKRARTGTNPARDTRPEVPMTKPLSRYVLSSSKSETTGPTNGSDEGPRGPGMDARSRPETPPVDTSVVSPVTATSIALDERPPRSEPEAPPASAKPAPAPAITPAPATTRVPAPVPVSQSTAAETRQWQSARSGSMWRQSRFEGLTLAPSVLIELVEWVMEGLDLEPAKPSITQVPGHFIGLARYLAHNKEGRPHGVQIEVIGGLQRTRLLMRVYAPDARDLEDLHSLVHEELALRLEVAGPPSLSSPLGPSDSSAPSRVQRVSGDYVCGSKTEVRDSVVSRWGKGISG